jgi:hypothetical protein
MFIFGAELLLTTEKFKYEYLPQTGRSTKFDNQSKRELIPNQSI